jgi:hypothetical protein
MRLVLIVRLTTFKYHMQGDIEVAIIDFTGQIRNSRAGGEQDSPRVIREVFFASRNHYIDGSL